MLRLNRSRRQSGNHHEAGVTRGCRAGLNKLREIPGVQGMTEIDTLSFVTLPGLKKSELLFCLHALGNHPMFETSSHVDHCTDNRGIVGIEKEIVHERLVDLQGVDRELRQVAQARVAGAEVIDSK